MISIIENMRRLLLALKINGYFDNKKACQNITGLTCCDLNHTTAIASACNFVKISDKDEFYNGNIIEITNQGLIWLRGQNEI